MIDTEPTEIPQKLKRLNPRFILIIALILLLTLFGSAFFELRQTRHEIHGIMEEEAATLMESISRSGTNAIKAFDEIERLVEDKLFSVAYFVQHLETHERLTPELLDKIAKENNVFRINIFDSRGQKIVSNFELSPGDSLALHSPETELAPILNGITNELVLGLKESRHPGENRFAVAIRSSKGGAIVTNIDAAEMLEFRKNVGIGRLMQNISDYRGIEYIVLQDYDGIILASKGISALPSIASDSFLTKAFEKDTLSFRFVDFQQNQIFEAVKPFKLDGEMLGLFRIGLKTDHLQQAESRLQRRMLIMSVVLGFILLILFNFLTINQNYRLVREAYQRIRTYSRNILEHMTDAVIAINQKKEITLFNAAASQLFKIEPDQILQKSAIQSLPADISALYDALENGKTVKDLEQTLDIVNRRLITSISTSILYNEKGEIDSAFAVIKDLTEKRNLEETLQRKEKLTAMGQLASGVAHEIRNPLNAIGVISQRLNLEFKVKSDEEEYYELTNLMVQEVRRINQIIEQFLKFARPPQLVLMPTNLVELLESTISFIRSEAEANNVKILSDFQSIPALLLDQNQIKQALLNILRNSLEAIDGPGTIEVRTTMKHSGEVSIEIIDSGKGINPETLSKIFNLYYTTKPKGTGLGLSLVHQIISQHNGRIEVESEPGNGTRFVIYLPIN
ncbi:PAS domain-containing protein [candidate division KSB1 bacterium]|nr:PAS domain-containing protein [candidate division KSB1 bacterium]